MAWLESDEGLRWSWMHHHQNKNQRKLFSLKADDQAEGLGDDLEWVSWGRAWTWGAQP